MGVRIPNWDTLLKIASQCYELTGLGYIGVDLDRHYLFPLKKIASSPMGSSLEKLNPPGCNLKS